MKQPKRKWQETGDTVPIEQLLASHYSRLMEWGAVLTRGDAGKTEEIVQDLCLYWMMAKPDVSGVANLDGYLYTCLRHIYLSSLARSSREALCFVSTEEFDSFDSALAASSPRDLLQRQNDLRRICSYAVWRKQSSKSASYFILHFFHDYTRQEIAGLACLPIPAIYNKLKVARSEVRSHLEEASGLRIVARNRPPEPALSWSVLSSGEVFKELRAMILGARVSECLSEEELLAYYQNSSISGPIPCLLLAHIVSCERCLAIVDRNSHKPTLRDRDPSDGVEISPYEGKGSSALGSGSIHRKKMLSSLEKRWGRIYEHRPKVLFIAVNGTIVAFHDVEESQSSKLAARIDPEDAQFVEIFSEQGVRLALLPLGELPPDGPDIRTQKVRLSDARWLELNLAFDGLGLNSEVTYFDPALATDIAEDPEESPAAVTSEERLPRRPRIFPRFKLIYEAFARIVRGMVPSSAAGWALALVIAIAAVGYLVHEHRGAPLDAGKVLSESVQMESTNLQGQTEHQVLRVEEISPNGQVSQQGTVDLWKDGDGRRYLRRFYDSNHRQIAVKWRDKHGEYRSRWENEIKGELTEHHSLMDEFWDQDLSAHAFELLVGKASQIREISDGYELTTGGATGSQPRLVSASLILDHRFLPIRLILRLRSGTEVHELRFVQETYQREPSASVSDTVFDPDLEHPRPSSTRLDRTPSNGGAGLPLAELQVAILYQLNRLSADTGEPIEVVRTQSGGLRVSGVIADDVLRAKIVSRLLELPDHQLLDLDLLSSREARLRAPKTSQELTGDTRVYEITQTKPAADALLRRHFQAKGLSGEDLNSAVEQFSHDALQHAQRALQHAYALERLGSALSADELASIPLASRLQWVEMVDRHSSALVTELRSLRGDLFDILPTGSGGSQGNGAASPLEDPAQFNQAAMELLHQAQDLNQAVSSAFASNGSSQREVTDEIIHQIPLQQAEEMMRFADRLNASARSAFPNPQNSGGRKSSEQPQ